MTQKGTSIVRYKIKKWNIKVQKDMIDWLILQKIFCLNIVLFYFKQKKK